MTTIRVEVTADDIARGQRGNARGCPIWQAGQRVTPKVARVDCQTLTLRPYKVVWLARDVVDWMKRFDEQGEGEPFSLDLEVQE